MRSLFPLGVVLLIVLALPGVGVFAADLLGYGADLNAWLESRVGVSHRLAVSVPAAIALFCVPPAIVLLYFLRLRRTPVQVSSTFLWHKSIEDLHVNRLMQWLRRNVLLLLQLLAVLLMIYAVLGPRLHAAVDGGRYYILLIDNSASMSATDVSPSRLAWARAEALREIDAATDTDSGMVIVFNRTAEIRQSYTTDRDLLRAAVAGIEPTPASTRLDEALNLAESRANPARSTENEAARPDNPEPGKERTYVPVEGFEADVHLYSDGGFPPVPGFALANLNLNYHVPPAPRSDDGSSNNLAILRLDAARDEATGLTVTAMVRNYRMAAVSEQSVRLEVLDAAGIVVRSYAQSVRLGPKGDATATREVAFAIPDLPEAAGLAVRVRLVDTADALPLDDVAWLVPGIGRKARVLAFLPDNPAERDVPGLRRFLDLPSTRQIADITRFPPERLTDPTAYLDPARDGKYDLVIFDRCGPRSTADLPRANTFFVGYPPPPFQPAGTPGDPLAVRIVNNPRITGWSTSHPVTRRLWGLHEVQIADAFRLPSLPPKTERLIESDGNLVLLAAIPRPPFTDLVLSFPIHAADGKYNTLWPVTPGVGPGFVIFLRNVVRSLGNVRDALADDVTRPGDPKHLWADGATLRVTTPGSRVEELARGSRADFVFADTQELGLYTAATGSTRQRFAVNLFDAQESDIAPRGTATVGSQTVTAGEPRRQPHDLWKLAVLGGLLVLLTEWWVYNKRVAV
jgi:hypothetical protein